MATIIVFNSGPRVGAGRRPPYAQPAEIVFFPGIRYERWGEENGPSRSQRRVRDRIDLGE